MNTLTQNNELWNSILNTISQESEKTVFDAFFRNTKIYEVNDNKIYILCESRLAKSVLRDEYFDYLSQKIHQKTSSNYVPVLITQDDIKDKKTFISSSDTVPSYFKNSLIDPHYTFDNFVVGPCNSEAQKAAVYTASAPGGIYQTLFIYGASGLGKTHLLNAIGNYIKANLPSKKVLFFSSQDFLNEYIDFVNGDTRKEQLFKFLKSFDVLLIDDIQMLKDKRKTQEFFFNIYEDFRQNHKQICVTSDRLPGELEGIDQRILTRFTSGLSVSVSKPDTQTSFNILKSKILASGSDLSYYSEDVLYFMADKFKDSVRSLEGALMRLNFYASINKAKQIDINICTEALQAMVDCSDAKNKVTEQKILNAVSSYYSLSVSQILGKIKSGNVVNARHIAIYLFRDLLDLPLKKIGAIFSGRDHTTVMHSIEKVDRLLKTDVQTQTAVRELKKRIQSQ